MTPQEVLESYLDQQHMMQLAMLNGDQPRAFTVYYVHDDQHNLYWASLPSRRHSEQLKAYPKVGAAIPVKFVKGEKVAGLQIEGVAEEMPTGEAIRALAKQYATKFGRDAKWIEDFTNGSTGHRLYKLTPTSIELFDESNFPDSPLQKVL